MRLTPICLYFLCFILFVFIQTGGPGCSSTLALLTENGPCSVNDAGDGTTINPYSWTEAAHVLWLDQPAGVGFSYGDETDTNEAMISEDAYYFLQAFFQTYPQYLRKDPFLYVVGESYGGHYGMYKHEDSICVSSNCVSIQHTDTCSLSFLQLHLLLIVFGKEIKLF